jgi:hypothetical protein
MYCSVLGHSALQLRVSQGALSALGGTHESNDPSSAAFCSSVSAGRGQHGESEARGRLVPDVMAGSRCGEVVVCCGSVMMVGSTRASLLPPAPRGSYFWAGLTNDAAGPQRTGGANNSSAREHAKRASELAE